MQLSDNSELQKLIPVLVLCIILVAIVLIPMKIIAYGFLPQDDTLRHTAKVVSGKDWDEVLVIRSGIHTVSHPGWHAILGAVYRFTGCEKDRLVVFSVVSLFLLFCLIPLFSLSRPEAWPLTLLTVTVINPNLVWRLFLGRPYIFSMSAILALAFLWPRLRDRKIPYSIFMLMVLIFAASTWIHCGWYLFALPLACFFMAREWRAGIRLCLAAFLGIIIGAAFTGHPYLFLKETLFHTIRAFGHNALDRMLAVELRPFTGENLMVMTVIGMLAWRKIRGGWDRKSVDNPVFILAVSGWILGFISRRFWLDWALPAVYAWMALEFQDALKSKADVLSGRRLLLTIVIAGTIYLGVTNDAHNLWTRDLTKEYLSMENPDHAPWLPGAGGVLYSDDMSVFYDTFYTNPHAPWRYILGFEPTMMPEEDLAIFRKIQWNYSAAPEAFEPWVKKMKHEDRLVLKRAGSSPPRISGLEWNYAASGTWIGRLPRGRHE